MGHATAVGFGLATAGGAGTADFLAKTTTDRVGALASLWYMEAFGAPVLVLLALVADGLRAVPLPATLALVGLSSLSLAGLFCLYRAFAVGRLSVVAPLTSGYPALVVLLSVTVLGERFSLPALGGLVATLLGIVLLTRRETASAHDDRPARAGVGFALLAFVAFGLFYFGLKFVLGPVPPTTGAAIVRLVGLAIVFPVLLRTRTPWRPPRGVRARAIGFPVVDGLSLVVFNLGVVRSGSLAVLTTVSGLYGAVTLAWAVLLLGERPSGVQWVGCALVFLGIGALALA